MELHIHLEGRGNLARQIYAQLRDAIRVGRLKHGDRLPPTRLLAQRLDVSRNTVSLAYEWLTAEGLLSGRTGAGSFVAGETAARRTRTRGAAIRHRAVWDSIEAPTPREHTPAYDFGVGMPDARLFPYDAWRRLLARQIRHATLKADYGDAAGHPRLRAAISWHVAVSRGVNCGAEDVLVTIGAQQAFDLIARVLLDVGSRVAVEDPGYPPARLVFESIGARVTPVPVDASGLVTSLPDDARLVYVTPSHQFPLGMPMSHARRASLLEWAERRNAVIVEDDYDSEFRFGGRPLETLQAIDRSGRVIYVGSFSKSLLPALRLGFLIAPPSLQPQLRAASFVAGRRRWPRSSTTACWRGTSARCAASTPTLTTAFSERCQPISRNGSCRCLPWLACTSPPCFARAAFAKKRRSRAARSPRMSASTAFQRTAPTARKPASSSVTEASPRRRSMKGCDAYADASTSASSDPSTTPPIPPSP
jgi:GntR family transcriptional regulator/MocR family aminotransferase